MSTPRLLQGGATPCLSLGLAWWATFGVFSLDPEQSGSPKLCKLLHNEAHPVGSFGWSNRNGKSGGWFGDVSLLAPPDGPIVEDAVTDPPSAIGVRHGNWTSDSQDLLEVLAGSVVNPDPLPFPWVWALYQNPRAAQ